VRGSRSANTRRGWERNFVPATISRGRAEIGILLLQGPSAALPLNGEGPLRGSGMKGPFWRQQNEESELDGDSTPWRGGMLKGKKKRWNQHAQREMVSSRDAGSERERNKHHPLKKKVTHPAEEI